jgi:DNA polymerase III delta prime subunit
MNPSKNLTHHAYLCRGNREQILTDLQNLFIESKISQPQIFYQYEKLGIDEVREISEIVYETTDGRIIVISAEKFTPEAQHGFLKVLEEPAEGLKIFLIIPEYIHILDTLLSRVVTLKFPSSTHTSFLSIKDFLFSSHIARLDGIETYIKSRDESLSQVEVMQFIDALESGLYILFQKKRSEFYSESFQAVRDARAWAGQTGFPLKNIVEYVAMVLPDFSQKK